MTPDHGQHVVVAVTQDQILRGIPRRDSRGLRLARRREALLMLDKLVLDPMALQVGRDRLGAPLDISPPRPICQRCPPLTTSSLSVPLDFLGNHALRKGVSIQLYADPQPPQIERSMNPSTLAANSSGRASMPSSVR